METQHTHANIQGTVLPGFGSNVGSTHAAPYIISKTNLYYRIWRNFLVLLAVYSCFSSPLQLGFFMTQHLTLCVMDNTINFIFWINIILEAFVGFTDKQTFVLITSPKKILCKKKFQLLGEFLSSIPTQVEFLVLAINRGDSAHHYGFVMINFLRLLRVRRVFSFFSWLEKSIIDFSYFWCRILKLTFITICAIHCDGCGYYFVSTVYPNQQRTWVGDSMKDFLKKSLWRRYMTSIYWSTTTLTTVGYGDYHAVNDIEMVYVSLSMLLNTALLAYLIGSISLLMVDTSKLTRQFRHAVKVAVRFGRRNHLPKHLQDEMVSYLTLKFRTDSEVLEQLILDSLPKGIKSSISQYLYNSVVDKVYLFNRVSDEFTVQLVSEMIPQYFNPGENIVSQNEAPDDFYIIVSGAVDFLVKRDGFEEVVGNAEVGGLCGEVNVICNKPYSHTIRASQVSQLLKISSNTCSKILRNKVRDADVIIKNIIQHLREQDNQASSDLEVEMQNKLSRGLFDFPVTLSFASETGKSLLIRTLLERGSDPDERDENGRTALHIAASRGNEEIVSLLLSHGANPNIRDLYGNVPLWESLAGNHHLITQILLTKGACLKNGDIAKYACMAAELNNLDLLKEIVKHEGDITLSTDVDGRTALHMATLRKDFEMVKFLLDNGANIFAKDFYGTSPIEIASGHGQEFYWFVMNEYI